MPITQNIALFSLLGTQFGGDGTSTFALPDLRGRVALGATNNGGTNPVGVSPHVQGTAGGVETITLPAEALASHTHSVSVSSANAQANSTPAGMFPAASVSQVTPGQPLAPFKPVYVASSATGRVSLNPATVAPTPAVQTPLDNTQPSLCMQFCIATSGLFPTRP